MYACLRYTRAMTKRVAQRRSERARRRIAERTKRNAEAVEAAVEIAEDPAPKRRYWRVKSQLELLAARRNITMAHRRAGERLERDYFQSQYDPAPTDRAV
jgi:hypothetical protein